MSQWLSDMPLTQTAEGVTSGAGQNMQIINTTYNQPSRSRCFIEKSSTDVLPDQNMSSYEHFIPQEIAEFEKYQGGQAHGSAMSPMQHVDSQEKARPSTSEGGPARQVTPSQIFSRRNS